ncbi:hypothetical protein GOODEAATRI_010150 [Goodea atripinnis]|uniref:Uncharacterized protein n=1 Tax=Goodea atripinnis TaxID=208336 RepID=A0ABV0P2Y8_9TELE
MQRDVLLRSNSAETGITILRNNILLHKGLSSHGSVPAHPPSSCEGEVGTPFLSTAAAALRSVSVPAAVERSATLTVCRYIGSLHFLLYLGKELSG